MGMNDNAQEFLSANQVSAVCWGGQRGEILWELNLSPGANSGGSLDLHSWTSRGSLDGGSANQLLPRRNRGCPQCGVKHVPGAASPLRLKSFASASFTQNELLVFLDAVRFPSIVCSSGVSFPHMECFL